jgi:hypothetical protein
MLLMGVALHAQVPELDRLLGKDLWKEQAKNLQRLNQMLGEIPPALDSTPQPWHVWKTSHEGRTRYAVLLGGMGAGIPGGASARVQLFDGSGKSIDAWSFQVGWRIFLGGASFEYSRALDSDLIVLHTAGVINGRDVGKEIFAIGNDRLRLVRLENSKGAITQSEYVYPQVEVNVVPDATSLVQFASLLESSDKADALSALVFLGGRHLDDAARMSLPEPHESKYAKLFQEVIGDPRIHVLIERLTTSDNKWIAQAAKLAARGSRERPLY